MKWLFNRISYFEDFSYILKKGFFYLKSSNNHKFSNLKLITLSLIFLGIAEGVAVYSFMLLASSLANSEFVTKAFSSYTLIKELIENLGTGFFVIISVILIVFANLISIFTLKKMMFMSFAIGAEISSKLFNYYIYENYLNFQSTKDSHKIKNIINSVDKVVEGVIVPHAQLFVKFIGSIFIVFILLMIDLTTTILVFLYLAVVVTIYHKIHKARINDIGQETNDLSAERIQSVVSSLSLKKEIEIYGVQNYFGRLYRDIIRSYASNETERVIIALSPKYILEIVAILSLAFLGFVFIFFGYSSDYVLPLISVYLFSGYRMIPFFHNIFTTLSSSFYHSSLLKNLAQQINSFESQEVINSKKRVEGYKKTNSKSDSLVSIKNIGFKYSDRVILKDLNMEIKKGSIISLMGPSGCGKTTFISILSGLISPDSGSIEFHANTKNNFVALVPQHITLYPGSIKDNIIFGETYKNKDFLEVLKISCSDSFVENLELKENTVIGPSGLQLSGGQMQRIGIARALYKKPDLLIMDEATASLDSETERSILNQISALNITVIIITHNKSLQNLVDFRYFFQNKSIVGPLNADN